MRGPCEVCEAPTCIVYAEEFLCVKHLRERRAGTQLTPTQVAPPEPTAPQRASSGATGRAF